MLARPSAPLAGCARWLGPHLPGAERIAHVPFGDALTGVEIGSIGRAGVGTGGAETKVSAARIAAEAGAAVLITATPLVSEALAGAELGTWFDAAPERHTTSGDSKLA